MILPPEFIDSVSPDALNDFLDHLILSYAGNESYEGNIEQDRQRLLKALKTGELLIDHSEDEEGSFGLISREVAISKGYS